MSFSYDAGTTTPNLAGLAEIATIRINDGTYVLTSCGRLNSTSPLRPAVSTLSWDHGGVTGTPLYTEFPFTLEGYLTVPTLADIWAAYDLLFQSFNLDGGVQTLTLNASGWAAKRQLSVLVAGQIQLVEPTMLGKLLPDRDFVVPLVAPDPRLYATTVTTTTITSGGTVVTNHGTTATPITVRFNGPQTNPKLLGPGLTGNVIRYAGTVASGHWVEVNMNPTGDGVTALSDLGVNVMASISDLTGGMLPAASGGASYSALNDSGAGTTTLSFRDAWA